MIRVLLFGDVVASPGREALRRWLPGLKKKHKADVVIANVENLAHGKGITEKTLDELKTSGVDFFTSGNHIYNKDGEAMLKDVSVPVIRPANFEASKPGDGFRVVKAGKYNILVINLIGTAFFRDAASYGNPFVKADEILETALNDSIHAVIVDFHAEATSEKIGMGLYLDGRVSVVFGTHTHVTTADARILNNGTAAITDIGMTGLRDEVLGVERSIILQNFLNPEQSVPHRWTDDGPIQMNALLVEIDPLTRKAVSVELIQQQTES